MFTRIRLTGSLVACAAVATLLVASCGRSPSTQVAGGTGDDRDRPRPIVLRDGDVYADPSGMSNTISGRTSIEP